MAAKYARNHTAYHSTPTNRLMIRTTIATPAMIATRRPTVSIRRRFFIRRSSYAFAFGPAYARGWYLSWMLLSRSWSTCV